MNNLLVWPLSENTKIIFCSQNANLSTITCCDYIDIKLEADQKEYVLISRVTGCQLSAFKQSLDSIILNKAAKISLQEVLVLSKAELGQILLEIHFEKIILAYFLIDENSIQAWSTQLDLLAVVMQENENEKKIKGKGCC